MSQNTTTQSILKIVALAMMIQGITLTTHAAGTCMVDKSDIREDTQNISEKLALKYGTSPTKEFKKVDLTKFDVNKKFDTNKMYDDQELKVDRTVPFLDQLNAIGVVSDRSLGSLSEYGSAVLISPCHVLINRHATANEDVRQGNLAIFISLGQTSCEDENEFLHQDMAGKVIAVGNSLLGAEDYALVRINALPDIKPALVSIEYMSYAQSLMIVGFPLKSTHTQKTGFRYPTANFVKMKDIGPSGTFVMSNTSHRPGGSGSGVFVLDDDNGRPVLVLAAIHRSEGGIGIQTASILDNLKTNNPRVFKELAHSIKTNSCD